MKEAKAPRKSRTGAKPKPKPAPEYVDHCVRSAARRHHTTIGDLLSRSRARRPFHARLEVMRRMRADGYTVQEIGKALGRDHSTVLHGLGVAAPGLWFGR